ncbi:MAG TPA: rod shape-determining protein MreC [Kofleriaceae bacterium]|nr:rod shape-determining protein MreC [Kofleriaceae bacterium]
MTLTRRAREWVIVAILLALPLLVLRANLKSTSDLTFLDRGILRVSAPLQSGLIAAARGVGNAWSRYVALWRVSDDNVQLKDENARLKAELERLRQEAARGADLEKLLHLRADVHAETLSARVIGAETSAFFRVVRVKLDRGDLEVKPGMPVVASAGVVGRVQRVFGPYSDVLLASDPKSALDILITSPDKEARVKGRGVLKGIPGDSRYRTRIDYLLRKDEVAEGDIVVTSGLGGFPRHLPVGRIVKVQKRDFGLYQDAEVEPAVEFGKLSEVLVVLQAPPPEEKAEK